MFYKDCTLEDLVTVTDKEQEGFCILFEYCEMGSTVISRKVGSKCDNALSSNGARRFIASEDVDPQYWMFMENLREDGNSYALEAVGENGVSELIRYHREDGISRRVMRRSVPDEDVDSQYKLFMENLREDDGGSYALEVVKENGISQVIRYHRDGLGRRSRRRSISIEDVDPLCKIFSESLREDPKSEVSKVIRYQEDNVLGGPVKGGCHTDQKLDNPMLCENCEKTLSLVESGDDENEKNSGDDNSDDVKSVDFSSDDVSDRFMDNGKNEGEYTVDDNIELQSVHDGHNWNQKPSDDDVHGKSSEDGAGDPKTNLHSENLREDGNSYAQDTVQESGSSELIKYKQMNGLQDVPMLATTENIKNSNVNNKFESRDTTEDPRKRISSVVMRSTELTALDPASALNDGVSCKRSFLEVPHNSVELNADTRETERNSQVKEKTEIENRLKIFEYVIQTRSSSVKGQAQLEIQKPVSSRTRGKFSERPHLESPNTSESLESEKSLPSFEDILEGKSSRVNKKVKGKAAYPASGRMNACRNRGAGLEVPQHFKYKNFGEDDTESDESYQNFLNFTALNYENVTYVPPNGTPVTYDFDIKEENTKTSSGPDLIAPQRDPVNKWHTPIMREPDIGVERHTDFREGLMEDLRRPYDQDEYLKLLEDWSRQRPGTAHAKNFRSGVIKTYALKGEYGKPYMEVYKDLAAMITASDRPGKLNLLRGYFYWLKNVAQEGSFEPWSDKEYLDTCGAANVD